MNSGILIAIEGIDGAGKTTLAEAIAAHLRGLGKSVVTSKEPTNGAWGQKIRQSAATGRMSLKDELHAFIEDRKEHVHYVIEPALAAGKVVILDRYFYSTIAYQGSRGGDVAAITELVFANAIQPKLVILLDVPAEIGLARVGIRGDRPNAFERVESLTAARAVFQDLAERYPNVQLIDARSNTATVQKAAIELISKTLGG
jgi:dTMP kinase